MTASRVFFICKDGDRRHAYNPFQGSCDRRDAAGTNYARHDNQRCHVKRKLPIAIVARRPLTSIKRQQAPQPRTLGQSGISQKKKNDDQLQMGGEKNGESSMQITTLAAKPRHARPRPTLSRRTDSPLAYTHTHTHPHTHTHKSPQPTGWEGNVSCVPTFQRRRDGFPSIWCSGDFVSGCLSCLAAFWCLGYRGFSQPRLRHSSSPSGPKRSGQPDGERNEVGVVDAINHV